MSMEREFPGWHGTTIVGVARAGQVAIAGDGQVSLQNTVIKGNARKVRRLSPGGYEVVAGFAGATADAFALLERLETKLEAAPGQLMRAAVELAKDWRTDKYLQKLEAMLIVSDGRTLLVVTGAGDVLEPEGASPPSARAATMRWPRRGRCCTPRWTPRRWRAKRWRSPRKSASTPTATRWWR